MKDLIENTFKFIYSFIRLICKENLRNYFPQIEKHINSEKKELIILGNGPSLAYVIDKFVVDDAVKNDFCFVNYLVDENIFNIVKPVMYVLSDEQFFLDNHPKSIKAAQMIDSLNNKTSWPLVLLIPFHYWKKNILQAKINNDNIQIFPFHHYSILGKDKWRYFFFKKGLGTGEFGTVVQNAIYCGLTLHYNRIHIYGVDHNFFDNLSLDEDNNLQQLSTHFYDKGNVKYTKIVNLDGSHIPVYKFLADFSLLFYGHTFLNGYANYLGKSVINHTQNSLIDAYIKE